MKINNSEIFVKQTRGQGKYNFVLIHNAGGSHEFFHQQIDLLKNYGNIIELDLPGHGNSEVIPIVTMDEMAALIAKLCQQLKLENISLIGLNNGANIAIEMVRNHKLPVSNLILIDPPLFMDEKFIGEINDFIAALALPDFDKFVDTLVQTLFIETEQHNKTIAKNAFNKVDRVTLGQMFKGLIEWNARSEGVLKEIKLPTLAILTNEHHCTYQKLAMEAPHFEIGKVIGSKCWATLEVPEQVNAKISRFLKIHALK